MKIFLILFMCLVTFSIASDNFSQWRGPARDGKYPDTELLQKWPSGGPDILWTATDLGEGFSSPAVTSEGVYVTGMINGTGYLFAFNEDGKARWKIAYGPEWEDGHDGTRTTPTVVDDKIYLMSGQGKTVCVNTSDGKVVWEVDLVKSFGARNLKWGITESVLVDGDRLFCTPGGGGAMMVILDRFSGKTLKVIEGNGEKSAYCSPAIAGTGGQLVKLTQDGKGVEKIWSDKTLDSQMGAAVVVGDYIYGSGHKNKGWHCIEWRTGNVQYTAKELGRKGNVIYADGLLYCYSESGDVGLVRPNPKKFEVISSFEIDEGSGSHWAHPVINDGKLYVRHGDVLMVYDIRSKK
jgi:outer membrane protein assembly factor BamB